MKGYPHRLVKTSSSCSKVRYARWNKSLQEPPDGSVYLPKGLRGSQLMSFSVWWKAAWSAAGGVWRGDVSGTRMQCDAFRSMRHAVLEHVRSFVKLECYLGPRLPAADLLLQKPSVLMDSPPIFCNFFSSTSKLSM